MQEIIVDILLAVVIVTAAVFRFVIGARPDGGMTRKQKVMLVRILIASSILLVLQLIPTELFSRLDGVLFSSAGRWLRFALYLADYFIIGYDILRKAIRGILNRQVFDENFLMAVATVGAMALAIYENGDYLEAIAVMLFYQIGEWFQSYAVGRSRRSISDLMDIRPDYANIEQDGDLEQVDPDEVEIGSIIVVQPGEKVPIDGIVAEGSSTLNTSALTGESLPREVQTGDEIISGCINMTGVLKIRTTKEFGESTVSKILDLVENASSRKSRSEDFISKFARIYTPAVCYSALALAILPPLVRMLAMGLSADWGTWVYRALTFLVISCPCALVISIPLSFFAGIGGASREGVLVKGSNYLEILSQTKTVVFDKTGTLTQGVFEVAELLPAEGVSEKELLRAAAQAEAYSNHPIAQSLRRVCGENIDPALVTDVKEAAGRGVTAKAGGASVAAGNEKLMADLGIKMTAAQPQHVGTVVHVARDGQYLGQVVIADAVKQSAPAAIAALKARGIRTVMLTGDRKAVGEAVAAALGLDEVRAELLPGDKVAQVERLLEGKAPKSALAYVGDGVNDAPVLSRADVGVAMGAMGSDAALEAADVVLMDDDLAKLPEAMDVAKKCSRIVVENIVFALGVKGLFLLLGALGMANMWEAVFADVGVAVIAILNSGRMLRSK